MIQSVALRQKVLVILLTIGLAAMGSGCSSSAKEPLPPGSLPVVEDDAVFGLSWEYTEAQLIRGGVITGEPEPFRGHLGRMYAPARLPRGFEDSSWCALFFNATGELVRVACVGETVEDDPEGVAIRERYEELKNIISRKIPIVGTYEESPEHWARPQDWWSALKDGKAHWATGFRGEVMEAVLEIRAESETTGSYSLIVDNLPRMQRLNSASDESDSSAF